VTPPPAIPAPRLIAILAADAVGYSLLMAADDRLTVELLDAARAVFRQVADSHQGRVVDMAGDSVLIAFNSAASAVRCALAVQARLTAQSDAQSGTLRLPFRIGVHVGDVIEKADGSVYGDGVNIAARLQALAEADEVLTSQSIRDLLGSKPVADFEDVGEHQLKNVARPLRVWRAVPPKTEAQVSAALTSANGDVLRFAERYELQPGRRQLLQDGIPLLIGARAFDLLLALVERCDRVVTKTELLDLVWRDLVVEENNLPVQISALRKLLGPHAIATIPGRGYRFTALVEGGRVAAPAAPRVPEPFAATRPPTALPVAAAPEAPKLQDNLPATLTPLLGRAEDLAALSELIDQHRLVSIIGAGGMGKTTVAQHLTASRQGSYRHGVCWVELATIANAEVLPAAIGSAIGVNIGDGEPLAGLCNALRPLTMLVALDNAEQVVDGVARVVQAVLDQAPALRFIVTSQAPLKLAAEHTYLIGALAVPQGPLPAAQALEFGAVALFTERAQAADARFSLSETNAPAVIDLCRQLDGLPLAIELAASRVLVFGIQRLVASMGDRLRVLTSSRNRLAPARQQTLRAALEWSHGFLDERERAVFRRLAVFAGSVSLSMVQQVVSDPAGQGDLDEWAVLDALALLVERSLVVAITPDEAVEPRYRLLDTPRVFAWEKLREAAEEAPLRQRHAHAVAAYFFEAQGVMDSGTVRLDPWRHAMAADFDNGREALGWARSADDAVRIVQIATAIARALPPSAYREKVALGYEVEPLVERINDPDLLALLCWTFSAASRTQPHRVLTLIRRCVIRLPSESASDTVRFARYSSLCVLARSEVYGGELSAAEAALAAARELVDPTWPPIRQRKLVMVEALVAAARGDASAARRWARQVIALDDAIGDSDAKGRINLIDTELAAGDATSATVAGVALLADLTGGRDEHALAFCRLVLGAGYLVLGDREQARLYLRAGWAQAALFDLEIVFADHLALLAALDGRYEAAARLAGYADAGNAHAMKRERNEAAAITRAAQLARAGLGETIFDQLHAQGCSLRGADIEALAFGPGLHDMVAPLIDPSLHLGSRPL
jgi:predicted ATPase/class 3 adenylate cyclase/DNA-binding winged helix-turn-helix (wHTH) protein